MKRISLWLVVLFLAAGLTVPAPTFAQDTEDVIILCNGGAEAVASQIEAMGGRVNIKYKNVSALAATVPSGQLAAIRSLANVASVEKDTLVTLPRDRDAAGRPLVQLVEDQVQIDSIDLSSVDVESIPEGYANAWYTGAFSAWPETMAGAGSIVAVVDTGTVPNVCLEHAVIGAPGFPDGYNSTGDGFPATDPGNHWHGTFVGGVIASGCVLSFTDVNDPLYKAIALNLGWPPDFVPIWGQAPESELYPVKVFSQSGAGSPNSIILAGLDHILTLKKDGLLDIDIVNMSLGGATLFDGRDTYDRFLEVFKKYNMLVVTSAGNEGPIPNTVGSPATSFGTLAVGATDEAPSSRVFYEYLGLVYGPDGDPLTPDEGPGQGLIMRPGLESRIVNYSARGPMTDGRVGPDMVALGHYNFHAGPDDGLMWAGGTSFSAPTVAGAAALLNAWWENNVGIDTYPGKIRNSLLMGANPEWVAEPWRDENTQGAGVVDVPESLGHIKDKRTPNWWPIRRGDHLEPNLFLESPKKCDKTEASKEETFALVAGETTDLVLAIDRYTSKVIVEVKDIVTPDNSADAYWPNALQVNVQSAKRTAIESTIGWYWYPYFYGDRFKLEIEDGPWTSTDMFGGPYLEAYHPMEPGLMKVTFSGDYSNEAPVSFKVKVTRESRCKPKRKPIARGEIANGDQFLIGPFKIAPGHSQATFDLVWGRDWSRFPTSDIDFLVLDETFTTVGGAGSLDAPERAIIGVPPAGGEYYLYLIGYEVPRPDRYKLFLTVE